MWVNIRYHVLKNSSWNNYEVPKPMQLLCIRKNFNCTLNKTLCIGYQLWLIVILLTKLELS